MKHKNVFWIVLWVILVIVTGYFAFGYGYGPGGVNYRGYGPWHGWSPMAGWDRADSNPVYGRGGLSGMGPWMMGQYNAMPGFGGGMGLGMWEGNNAMMPWWLPDLSSDQTDKLGKLQLEYAERNRDAMSQILDAQARLNSLYATPTRDWNAIRTSSQNLFDLQRRQLEGAIDLQQKIDGILTDNQRRELTRNWRRYRGG